VTVFKLQLSKVNIVRKLALLEIFYL